MGQYSYKTSGTCSTQIDFEIEEGIIKKVQFHNGCNGNLQGICKLTENKSAKEIIELLGGIKCGYKDTSCPDQLASALKQAIQIETSQ